LSGEVFVGMAMGMVGRMIFATLQFGGSVIDSELGLMAAQQLNPLNGFNGGVFGQILFVAGLFYFWSLDYFSVLILALHESFSIVPLAASVHSLHSAEILAKLGAAIFAGGVMIATPIMAVMFFLTITIGLLSRAIQGLNIFAESFTMKILVGISAVLLFLPLILLMVRDQLERLIPSITDMLKHSLSVTTP
ncbi:MAG: flagellar biosynthetic protein FliR, partial [Verrucomicrobiota bacterium]